MSFHPAGIPAVTNPCFMSRPDLEARLYYALHQAGGVLDPAVFVANSHPPLCLRCRMPVETHHDPRLQQQQQMMHQQQQQMQMMQQPQLQQEQHCNCSFIRDDLQAHFDAARQGHGSFTTYFMPASNPPLCVACQSPIAAHRTQAQVDALVVAVAPHKVQTHTARQQMFGDSVCWCCC